MSGVGRLPDILSYANFGLPGDGVGGRGVEVGGGG